MHPLRLEMLAHERIHTFRLEAAGRLLTIDHRHATRVSRARLVRGWLVVGRVLGRIPVMRRLGAA